MHYLLCILYIMKKHILCLGISTFLFPRITSCKMDFILYICRDKGLFSLFFCDCLKYWYIKVNFCFIYKYFFNYFIFSRVFNVLKTFWYLPSVIWLLELPKICLRFASQNKKYFFVYRYLKISLYLKKK